MHNARPREARETPTHGWTERDLEKETLRPVLLLLLRPIITVNTLVSAFSLGHGTFFSMKTQKRTKKEKKIKIYSEKSHIHQMFLK